MTEYIKDMRKLVGQKPILQCGASTIILNSEQQLLLLRRTDNNCWCIPGGAVELGEQTEEAAVRETKEETGLQIDIGDLELFHVFSGKELYYQYPNGDEVYNICIVYIAKKYSGNIVLDNESKEYGFFNINELPLEINPPEIPVINRLKTYFEYL